MNMDEVLKKIENLSIEEIHIKGLFGKFDYEIPLKRIGNLAILYGLNGIGKTTILKLIDMFSYSIFEEIYKIKFEEIVFKLIPSQSSDFPFVFFVYLFNTNSKILKFSFKSEIFNLEQEYSDIHETGIIFRMIREIRVPEKILYDVIKVESEISCQEPHDFFASLLSHINCWYIQSLRNNINDFNILDSFYKNKRKEYKQAIKDKKKVDKQIRKFKVEPFSSIEILNEIMDYFFQEKLNEVSDGIVYLYTHNIKNEFKIEIGMYEEIINSLLDFKKIKIDKDGLKCILENNEILPLTKLSSGEKNLIIMLYEILFNAHNYSIILVDEPEISLNINWHYDFIDILKEIKELKKFQYIIATHSPQIVNDNISKCIDLKLV